MPPYDAEPLCVRGAWACVAFELSVCIPGLYTGFSVAKHAKVESTDSGKKLIVMEKDDLGVRFSWCGSDTRVRMYGACTF